MFLIDFHVISFNDKIIHIAVGGLSKTSSHLSHHMCMHCLIWYFLNCTFRLIVLFTVDMIRVCFLRGNFIVHVVFSFIS